jgi:hypothetical protein
MSQNSLYVNSITNLLTLTFITNQISKNNRIQKCNNIYS